jgi:phenylalanine-4-hydroxylase
MRGHMCQDYLDGLTALGIGAEGVPNVAHMRPTSVVHRRFRSDADDLRRS